MSETKWKFVFRNEAGVRIEVQHTHDDNGEPLRTSPDASCYAQELADMRGWRLIVVEQM